jgi:radical SAM protein with 4Fe4S-binding SPASM domain
MFPDRITFQWHLTDVCNYRCKHCYQANYTNSGEDVPKLLDYLQKIVSFAEQLKLANKNFKAHINFTGGEPFIKSELLDLIQAVNNSRILSFAILSNGFLLKRNELLRLKELNPRFIQLSLEGNRSVNDSIRGKGSYNQVLKAIKTYNKLDIPILISFTANAINYKFFPDVVKVAQKLKVHKIWTDRYLPDGLNDELSLSTEQVKDFFQIIQNSQKRKLSNLFSKTIISSSRALQFLINGGEPYSCSAGFTLLAILPDGDVFPCRRLPIKIGNLSTDNLMDIYQSDILKALRKSDNIDQDCNKCYYIKSCKGGLKCLSFATYGDFNRKDPNCWIKK